MDLWIVIRVVENTEFHRFPSAYKNSEARRQNGNVLPLTLVCLSSDFCILTLTFHVLDSLHLRLTHHVIGRDLSLSLRDSSPDRGRRPPSLVCHLTPSLGLQHG